jgi:hypothetical protein
VDEAYERAKEILTMYKQKLIEISELLIEKETLDAPDFEALFDGMPRPEPKLTQPPKLEKVKPSERPRDATTQPGFPDEAREPTGQPLPGLKPGMATFAVEERGPDGT